MTRSRDNLIRWIDQTGIDYITHYIKVWIAFNAWYKHAYPQFDTDREIINTIKNSSNDITRPLKGFMNGTGAENDLFKNHLAILHNGLQNYPIENNGENITFLAAYKEYNTRNQVNNEVYNRITYFLLRTDNARRETTRMQVILKSNGGATTFFNYSHTAYDEAHFIAFAESEDLSTPQRIKAISYFKSLCPFNVINLIEPSPEETNCYNCAGVNFIRQAATIDPAEKVTKGIIEVLYQLRNVVFHGELNPNQQAQTIYQPAYFILKMLVERLR